MKVRELITELKSFHNQDLIVAGIDGEMGEYEIDEVKLGLISKGNTMYFKNAKAQQPIVELS